MTTLPAVVRIVDLPAATTITGAELFEAVQTSGGVGLSVQVPLTAVMTTALGALPTGGGTSQILAKSSGSNFAGAWYDVTNFVSVNTASSLATSGTGTSLVIGVATGGITSTQIANNAVGTNQLASSLGIASSLSVGTLLTVGGTATFNGTAIFNATAIYSNGLQVTGTSLLTGTFGVVGTSQFTGAFNVAGTALYTGTFGIVGTTNVTGVLNQVGTANFTGGTFGVNATANFTGVFGVVGTTLVTGRLGVVGTSQFTGVFSVVGTTLFTSGTFGVVGTTLFTSTFGIVGTALFTGVIGAVGTATFTGTHNIIGTTTVNGTVTMSTYTAGVIVASSTGVLSNQGGMVLLNTLSPSGVASTNDTTSFTSSYRTYMFVLDNVCPSTNTTSLQMQVATSGSNFTTAGYMSGYQNLLGFAVAYGTAAFLLSGNTATTSVSSSAVYGVNGIVYLHNPASSVARKAIDGITDYQIASSAVSTATIGVGTVGGVFDGNSNPITGVNFLFSSGNIATGTIKVYGIT